MKDNRPIRQRFEDTKNKKAYKGIYQNVLKRIIDIVFCLVVIPLLLPVMVLCAILVKIGDGGPIFYKSKRIGKSFKQFNMFKFRSMVVNAVDIRNEDGGTFNSKNDSRVTKIGRFLRETSLDELPQVFNIFLGQMSLIGPRAGDVESKDTYSNDEKDKMLVKPGLTGYTQAYYRNGVDVRTKRLCDAWYAHNVSVWLDIKIFFKSIITVLRKENIYTDTENLCAKTDCESAGEFSDKTENKKSCLIFNAYYPPEIASSLFLEEDIANAICDAGFKTTMYVPTPSRGLSAEQIRQYRRKDYREEFACNNNLHIIRYRLCKERKNVILRAIRYKIQNRKQYRLGIKSKNIDVVFCGSTPPTQGLTCAKIAKKLSKKYKRHVPFIYNLQDVFPDSLVNTGLTKKGSLIWKLGRKIEDKTYNGADKIIVISEDFKRNIMAKGVSENKIEVVYNWIDADKVKPIERTRNMLFEEYGIERNNFVVVYAGNFGISQGVKVIIDAAALLKDEEDIKFVLFGGGTEYEEIKKYKESLGLTNVSINALLSNDRVSEVYSLGDVGLITCKKGFGACSFPSKTWSIMACNSYIIASYDINSELADIIAKSNCGQVVEPENADKLAKAILQVKENSCKVNGREYVEKFADKKVCVAKYVKVLTNSQFAK